MLGGVAGGRQSAQGQPTQVDLVTITQPDMVEGPIAGRAGEDLGAVIRRELAGAGQEVGVQMGLGRVRDAQPPRGGGPVDRAQIEGRVDGQGPAIAEVEQVGAVAQPLVDQRNQLVSSRPSPVAVRAPRPPTLFHRTLEDDELGNRDHKNALFDQFARVGKALASGKRLELLDLLAQGERDVASLAAAADLGLTTASAHLQTLRQANLVTTRRDGTRILYRLAGTDVADLFARLREVAQSHLPDVEAARVTYLGVDGGEPVTRDELRRLAKTTNVTVLDVRPAEEYAAGHIRGAVSIPLDELADRLAELPDDGQIVAYCRGAYCVLAHDAVRLLRAHGRDAVRLADGMLEWRLAGLPVHA